MKTRRRRDGRAAGAGGGGGQEGHHEGIRRGKYIYVWLLVCMDVDMSVGGWVVLVWASWVWVSRWVQPPPPFSHTRTRPPNTTTTKYNHTNPTSPKRPSPQTQTNATTKTITKMTLFYRWRCASATRRSTSRPTGALFPHFFRCYICVCDFFWRGGGGSMDC